MWANWFANDSEASPFKPTGPFCFASKVGISLSSVVLSLAAIGCEGFFMSGNSCIEFIEISGIINFEE